MRKLLIALALALAALVYGAAPGAAQVVYFGYSYGPGYYYGGYYHRPHRYYRRYSRRHHRHYYYSHRPRYYAYSPYTGRWTRDINELYGCPPGWTVQSGRCKPYRGY